jgi:hypothetical protein
MIAAQGVVADLSRNHMSTRFLAFAFALVSALDNARAQCPPQEVAGLTAPGNVVHEGFGSRVATSRDVAVVGSPQFAAGGTPIPRGAAFIYTRDPLNAHQWLLTKSIVAPTSRFTLGWEVAIDGDTAAIAYGEFTGYQSFVVGVFERNAGGANSWGQVATLHNDYYPGGNADHFGSGLVVQGDRIVVGAPYWGTATYGSVYVFERNAGGPGNWGQVKRILRPGQLNQLLSDFGRGLALDGDVLLVGDERYGRAYVYERNLGGPGQWGLQKSFNPTAPLAQSTDVIAVALRGDTLVLGCLFNFYQQFSSSVQVRERNLGGIDNWGLRQTLTPSVASLHTRFGTSLALEPGALVVGAPWDDATAGKQGAVYVFDDLGAGTANWTETARLEASDGQPNNDEIGHDVDLWHRQLIVGNIRNGTGTQLLGKVHVFDLESPAPPSAYCTAGTSSHGCIASLVGVGAASASHGDGFDLVALGVDGGRQAALFYGIGGPAAIAITGSTSWRCVAPPRQRMGILNSGGTPGVCDGQLRADWNAFVHANPGALGVPFAVGQTIWAQGWYRDPQAPSGGAATQGLSFTLCP